VRKRHPHISLATVHRTLETLCEIGEARKVTMLPTACATTATSMPDHDVVCIRCRGIRDLEIPGIDRLPESRSDTRRIQVARIVAGNRGVGCARQFDASHTRQAGAQLTPQRW
jgi:Fur family peroxide stress response transcriptional regulator